MTVLCITRPVLRKQTMQALGAACMLLLPAHGATLRVWRDNPGVPAPPYATWATAATNIQDAVAIAASGDDILVTNGVYDAGGAVTPGHQLQCRVAVTNAVTVRSVNGPDGTVILGAGPSGSNAMRGVYMHDTATLIGFTISNCFTQTEAEGGSSVHDMSGAGVFMDNGGGTPAALVSNCILMANEAAASGGGAYGLTPMSVMDCVFLQNDAASGGGCYQNGGRLARSSFVQNQASVASGYGGGAYLNGGSIAGCTFLTNTARFGGGAYAYAADSVRDTWFGGNMATNPSYLSVNGGGLYNNGAALISNCWFAGNVTVWYEGYGGGLYCADGTVLDCLFVGNWANFGGGAGLVHAEAMRCTALSNNIFQADGAGFYVSNAILRDSLASCNATEFGSGAGIAALAGALVSNCTAMGNTALGWTGGGILCQDNALALDCVACSNRASQGGGISLVGATARRCRVFANTATGLHGGGIDLDAGSLAELCTVVGNCAPYQGGGMYLYGAATAANSFVTGNISSNEGGGIYLGDWTKNGCAVGCTVVDNHAVQRGGGIRLFDGGHARNCIAMDNTALFGKNMDDDANTVAEFCCADPVPAGAGNFSAPPLLAGVGNPHLLAGSPCIDAGTNAPLVALDIDGEARVQGGGVDVGCDEFVAGGLSGGLAVAIVADTTVAVTQTELSFSAATAGRIQQLVWKIATDSGTRMVTNVPAVQQAWNTPGPYTIILEAQNLSGSAAATATVSIVAAVTNYVAVNGGHVAPFTSWATAATNIPAAVDAAMAGGVVILSNGTYREPAMVMVEKPITITSLGGWQQTLVDGGDTHPCFFIMQCAAIVDGLTLTNGYAGDDASGSGGGIAMDTAGTLRNCVVLDCEATLYGGGAVCHYGATVQNCYFSGNMAQYGGGVLCYYGGTVENSTIVNNRALIHGGGVFCEGGGDVRNSIMYYNYGVMGTNWYDSLGGMAYRFCATSPAHTGEGNTTADPRLAGMGNPHILTNSPCIDAGTNAFSTGSDIDREPRIYGPRVDIGCDEVHPTNMLDTLVAAIYAPITNAGVGAPIDFFSAVQGKAARLLWTIQTETTPQAATDAFFATHAWSSIGTYTVVLDAFNGAMSASATVVVHVAFATTNYVALDGAHVPPFLSWNNAATSIIDAIQYATAGNLIMVSNGTYYERDEVVVDRNVTVRSQTATGATMHGNDAHRVLRIDAPNAVVDGFFIFHGAAAASIGGQGGGAALNGGGFLLNCTVRANKSPDSGGGIIRYGGGVVSNGLVDYTTCAQGAGIQLVSGGIVMDSDVQWNNATTYGGGIMLAYGGVVTNCLIHENSAVDGGGGVYFQDGGMVVRSRMYMNNAMEGGGANFNLAGIMDGCFLTANYSWFTGAGVRTFQGGIVRNSLIAGNDGGGVYLQSGGCIANCTIVSNTSGLAGIKCDNGGSVSNTIVFFNAPANIANPEQAVFVSSCMHPLIEGNGNMDCDPQFVDVTGTNFCLSPASPCINEGANAPWMAGASDLSLTQRIMYGVADMGAYEFTTEALWCGFHGEPTVVPFGFNVTFNGMIAGTNMSSPYYLWDADNDGLVETQGFGLVTFTHAYPTEGVYSVRLVVSNAVGEGAMCVKSGYVTVIPEPTAALVVLAVLGRRKLRASG